MACRLFVAKPLPDLMLLYRQLDPKNQFQWNSNQNTIVFVQENAFEYIVCEMAAIVASSPSFTNMV